MRMSNRLREELKKIKIKLIYSNKQNLITIHLLMWTTKKRNKSLTINRNRAIKLGIFRFQDYKHIKRPKFRLPRITSLLIHNNSKMTIVQVTKFKTLHHLSSIILQNIICNQITL